VRCGGKVGRRRDCAAVTGIGHDLVSVQRLDLAMR
jgi:hypothetical protein